MKKSILLTLSAALALVGCSRTGLVNEQPEAQRLPIEFSVQKQNITKAAKLESVGHYNFGVFAWKVQGSNGLADGKVMDNYLVGWTNGSDKGYDRSKSESTTPWFYAGLGTKEYTHPGAGYYSAIAADYLSANEYQYVRYWDLAYAKTNFYCYAPYNKDVTFEKGATSSTLSFGATVIRDGYENPVNTAYDKYDRSLSEFMYAGVQAKNSDRAAVSVPFQHMGAQLLIRFYEDIPGYKVELIDLGDDNGTFVANTAADMKKGIQAAPAVKNGTAYELGKYYTTQGATVSFNEADAQPTYTAKWEGSTQVSTPLMFNVPETGLTEYKGHKVIQEKVATGTQSFSVSPTIYYPVAQPETSTTGFTFHVSYRVIAEDNQEVITVHNATVFVPCKSGEELITVWQPNVKYTYTFKITKETTGSTNPGAAIDPADPNPGSEKSLYPIIFENVTIADYGTEKEKEYVISE
jgi:hypothetical protein